MNIPVASKEHYDVLYVDHLDTKGLRGKYPTVPDLVEIDRPMINNSLSETLADDAPLDYLVASQVFEHVANPVRWLREIASVLRVGGHLALSLPDRRLTFDLMREESQPADIVSAYLEDATVPNPRCVYDHHSLASFINMQWATSDSLYPDDVVTGMGAVSPKLASLQHMSFVQMAKDGQYLDVHAWVFTPPSFLLTIAQLVSDGPHSIPLAAVFPHQRQIM